MGFSLFGLGMIAPQTTSDGGQLWVHNVGIFFVPWAIIISIVAFIYLKDVPVQANIKQQMDIFGNVNTWVLTVVYIMTFGAFAGFAAQFGLLVNNTFGAQSEFASSYDPASLPKGASFAFLAPLIGAGVRALWGPLCDKFGGAIWTFIGGVGMTISTAVAALFLHPDSPKDFWPFLIAMLVMFFFTGLGNAGTFKQMPMVLPKRQSGGVIGWDLRHRIVQSVFRRCSSHHDAPGNVLLGLCGIFRHRDRAHVGVLRPTECPVPGLIESLITTTLSFAFTHRGPETTKDLR